jgi:hypothetical protein
MGEELDKPNNDFCLPLEKYEDLGSDDKLDVPSGLFF